MNTGVGVSSCLKVTATASPIPPPPHTHTHSLWSLSLWDLGQNHSINGTCSSFPVINHLHTNPVLGSPSWGPSASLASRSSNKIEHFLSLKSCNVWPFILLFSQQILHAKTNSLCSITWEQSPSKDPHLTLGLLTLSPVARPKQPVPCPCHLLRSHLTSAAPRLPTVSVCYDA